MSFIAGTPAQNIITSERNRIVSLLALSGIQLSEYASPHILALPNAQRTASISSSQNTSAIFIYLPFTYLHPPLYVEMPRVLGAVSLILDFSAIV